MKNIYKNALVSVSNKEGTCGVCKSSLYESVRTRIGIHRRNSSNVFTECGRNLQIVSVSDQTKFPEVMNGRVKTLHPHIFLPILAGASELCGR